MYPKLPARMPGTPWCPLNRSRYLLNKCIPKVGKCQRAYSCLSFHTSPYPTFIRSLYPLYNDSNFTINSKFLQRVSTPLPPVPWHSLQPLQNHKSPHSIVKVSRKTSLNIWLNSAPEHSARVCARRNHSLHVVILDTLLSSWHRCWGVWWN